MVCPLTFRACELGAKRIFRLPPREDRSCERLKILLMTGRALRHEIFARRIAKAFPEFEVIWYRVCPTRKKRKLRRLAAARRVFALNRRVRQYHREYGLLRTTLRGLGIAKDALSVLKDLLHLAAFHRDVERAERRILQREAKELRGEVRVKSRDLAFPLPEEKIEEIRSRRPYFLLTCGGPLYPEKLIKCAVGAALNQHAGWAPTFRGSHTITWALYHRDLSRIASTVHLLTPHVDAGPVLRYGWVSLAGTESIGECFVRAVALGTELMIQAVQDGISRGELVALEQLPHAGHTFSSAECTGDIFRAVKRDLRRKWIRFELERLTVY